MRQGIVIGALALLIGVATVAVLSGVGTASLADQTLSTCQGQSARVLSTVIRAGFWSSPGCANECVSIAGSIASEP